jgi:diadenylate cyclase
MYTYQNGYNFMISDTFISVVQNTKYLIENIKAFSFPLMVIDIVIVSIIIYWIYIFLHETRAMRILWGLALLFLLMIFGKLFNLILLNTVLGYFATMLVVAIPIVFQPELRAALERLGRTKFVGDNIFTKSNKSKVIEEVYTAVNVLSKQKIGALIIFQRQTGLREYIENGTELDATVKSDLLLSIFYPKSPLHDGAVIIVGDKIVSVRSTLPVTDDYMTSDFGTRHKAAIGITERSDAVAIVVSEETGSVSMAVDGKIERRIAEDRVRNRLVALLRQKY